MHWKKELISQKLTKILILNYVFLTTLYVNAQNKNIEYKLNNSITQLLDTSESIYFKKIQKHKILYAKFSFDEGNTLISLSTANYGSELYKLITLSNRFLIISESKKIPIVFDFDFDFSTILNDSDSGHYQFGNGGFMVIFDKSGKIIKYGGQQ